MTIIFDIFLLLVIFQAKHLIADYFLQGKWMLQKFRPDWGFFFPLLAHAGIHALFTLVICLWLAPNLWWLALVDLIIHFVMDRIKAGPKYLGRFKALSGAEYMQTVRAEHWANKTTLTCASKKTLEDVNRKRKHNVYFWISLAVDQMVHHLTHYYIIFAIVMDKTLTC